MADSETQPTRWFYQLLGLPTGPVSEERIHWLIEQQHLAPNTMVGPSTNGPWVRLDQSDLSQLLPTVAQVAVAVPQNATPASAIPRKKPRRGRTSARAVTLGIEIDTEAPVLTETSQAGSTGEPGVRIASSGVAAVSQTTEITEPAVRRSSRPANVEVPTEVVPMGEALEPPPETPIGQGTDPEFEISLDEPSEPNAITPPVHPAPARTETQTSAARNLRHAKKARPKPGATGERRQLLVPMIKAAQRRPTVSIGVGLTGLVAMAFLLGLFSDPVDTEHAAETFGRVMTDLDANAEMSDLEWAKWCAASRDEVSAVLEPLRDHASADRPDVQNLMWAGDRLMLLLKGVRSVPPGVRARLEAHLAEYRGDPPEVPASDLPGDQQNQEVIDPIF